MNPLYEKIAKSIRMNTLPKAFTKLEADTLDKWGLVEALSNYFRKTDTLFNPDDFSKACEKGDQ